MMVDRKRKIKGAGSVKSLNKVRKSSKKVRKSSKMSYTCNNNKVVITKETYIYDTKAFVEVEPIK